MNKTILYNGLVKQAIRKGFSKPEASALAMELVLNSNKPSLKCLKAMGRPKR